MQHSKLGFIGHHVFHWPPRLIEILWSITNWFPSQASFKVVFFSN